jgi:SanA protein
MSPSVQKLLFRLALALVVLVAGVLGSSAYVALRYADRIVAADQAPEAEVALVFGAGLSASRRPSPVLAERIDAGLALYRAGKVSKVLLSGDNALPHHNETGAMRAYALAKGLPAEAILEDAAGLSTYDSCYRAVSVFGVKRALLVSQRFHLPRALFLSNSMGIDAYGVAADVHRSGRSPYAVRELVSRSLALLMTWTRSAPVPPA